MEKEFSVLYLSAPQLFNALDTDGLRPERRGYQKYE